MAHGPSTGQSEILTEKVETVQPGGLGAPGLGNEQLLEQGYGIPVGHSCHEILDRNVQAVSFDGLGIEVRIGPLDRKSVV